MDRRDWHLEKSVSVGHIVTTLVAAGSFFVWAMRQESRLTTLENHTVALAEADKRMDLERVQLKSELREDLKVISDKLDRLLEKRTR